jgi:hypothetical protein
MEYSNPEYIFWIGLRALGLILSIIALPITVILQVGGHPNVVAYAGVSKPISQCSELC